MEKKNKKESISKDEYNKVIDAYVKLEDQYDEIVNAVRKALKDGYRTNDIMTEGMINVGTSQMGEAIIKNIL